MHCQAHTSPTRQPENSRIPWLAHGVRVVTVLLAALATLWALSGRAAADDAGDEQSDAARYYVAPLAGLRLSEGTLPAVEAGSWNRWQRVRADTLRPTVTLDGPGEAYLHLPADWHNGPAYLRSAMLAVRMPVAKGEPATIAGGISLPKSDLSSMQVVRFTLPASAGRDDAHSRRRFYAAQESHYRRLLEAGLVGGAWFRHRLREARIAQGKPADLPPGSLPSTALDDTFHLLAPERGLSERLSLEVAQLPAAQEQRVKLSTLTPVTLAGQPSPTVNLPKAPLPDADPLAARVPHDQYAVFFPSFEAMVRATDEFADLGASVLMYLSGGAADRRLGPWYQRQMCVEVTPLDRALGAKLIASAVLTGADPYGDVGTDAALLFEARNVEALQKYFRAKQVAAKAAYPGVDEVRGKELGVDYLGMRTGDRRICSYLFTIDKVVGVTNSLAQLRRLVETAQQKSAALAGTADYRYFRSRHPRGEETACFMLGDAALRQLLSPTWRIGSSRRMRAAAQLGELQAAAFDDLVAGRIAAEGQPVANAPSLGKVTVHPGGVRSSVYGTLEFLTPIVELERGDVSQAEAEAYGQWRRNFEQRWQGLLSPFALQMTLKPERVSLSASMAPLPSDSRVQTALRWIGAATVRPSDEERRERTILHAAVAFDARSEPWRNFGELLDLYLGIAGAHRAIGPIVSLRADDSATWARLARAADPAAFWQGREEPPPLAAQLDGRTPEINRRILLSFERQKRTLFGREFTIEARQHEGLDYFRVRGGFLADELPTLYEGAGPLGLVVALSDAAARRSLDQQLARRKRGEGTSDAPAPLGKHLTLAAKRPALDVAERLLSTDVERTAQARSWSNLPILEEWKLRYPAQDPVALHQRFWYAVPECPGGGKYVVSKKNPALASTVFGRPDDPQETGHVGESLRDSPSRLGETRPRALFRSLRAGVTLEKNSLMWRAEFDRAAGKAPK